MTHGYLFFELYSTTYFLAPPAPTLVVGSPERAGCCVPSTCPIMGFVFFVGALPYFLVIQDAPGSSHTFPDPVLEGAICPRIAGSFCWIIVSESKIYAPGMLTASRPCQLMEGNRSGYVR